jgi:hypothetical protein
MLLSRYICRHSTIFPSSLSLPGAILFSYRVHLQPGDRPCIAISLLTNAGNTRK